LGYFDIKLEPIKLNTGAASSIPLPTNSSSTTGGFNFNSLLGSASSLLGPVGGVLSSVSALFGGRSASELVNSLLDKAKSISNVASGTLASYNTYLKELSVGYQHHYVRKGRQEASEIASVISQTETALQNGGYVVDHIQTSQSPSRYNGSFTFQHPVYVVGKATKTASKVFSNNTDNVNETIENKSELTKYVLIGLAAFVLLSKKFRRKLGI